MSSDINIPHIDVSGETQRQVVVDRDPQQYLGHVTTVLLEDGRTMYATYPAGHGVGQILLKRSDDGGLTWSERLPVPENWATSLEVPTIFRTIDKTGVRRLLLFSGMHPIRMAVSEDDGRNWSALKAIGDYGGVVAMSCMGRLHNGDYLAFFHDDERMRIPDGAAARHLIVRCVRSADGGLTWGEPVYVTAHEEAELCEPCWLRSPDDRRIAILLRENSRRFNSFVIFSDDEGESWSPPRELPAALTGDRHIGRHTPDGRLFITFRDEARESPFLADWVGWVGTFDDIVAGREGQYRIRLMHNREHGRSMHDGIVFGDCGYPGLELLPDGTLVTTTYGHWSENDPPYVVSVRLSLAEMDARLPVSG